MSGFRTRESIHNWLNQGKTVKATCTAISKGETYKETSVYFYKVMKNRLYYTSYHYYNPLNNSYRWLLCVDYWFLEPSASSNNGYTTYNKVIEKSSLKEMKEYYKKGGR